MLAKALIIWFGIAILFTWGWGRWQMRMEKYDGKK